jgi:PadR family transcriptional regulator, regulatory protein PadR
MIENFQRELMRGSLDLMVLSVLADKSQYGYAIQRQIREASSEQVKLPAGTLYPLLHRLEDERLIRSRWEQSTGRPRKWYEITASGRKQLASQAKQWRNYSQCVERLLTLVGLRPETA